MRLNAPPGLEDFEVGGYSLSLLDLVDDLTRPLPYSDSGECGKFPHYNSNSLHVVRGSITLHFFQVNCGLVASIVDISLTWRISAYELHGLPNVL